MNIFNYLKPNLYLAQYSSDTENTEDKNTDFTGNIFHQLSAEIILKNQKYGMYPYSASVYTRGISNTNESIDTLLENLSDTTLDSETWSILFNSLCDSLLHLLDEETETIFQHCPIKLIKSG